MRHVLLASQLNQLCELNRWRKTKPMDDPRSFSLQLGGSLFGYKMISSSMTPISLSQDLLKALGHKHSWPREVAGLAGNLWASLRQRGTQVYTFHSRLNFPRVNATNVWSVLSLPLLMVFLKTLPCILGTLLFTDSPGSSNKSSSNLTLPELK